MRNFITLFIICGLVGCAHQPNSQQTYLEAATLWTQSSAEARALRYQAFNFARLLLDEDLAKKSDEKRAIIVDVDETVLDNSFYQGRVLTSGEGYPIGWGDWISEQQAPSLPGALSFINYAHSKGVTVFYITSRKEKYRADTISNLKNAGFPAISEATVLCDTGEKHKEEWRKFVASSHRVVLIMGDNLADFQKGFESQPSVERGRLVDQTQKLFGTHYIILPNPMYGDWERAVYNYSSNLDREQLQKARRQTILTKPQPQQIRQAD